MKKTAFSIVAAACLAFQSAQAVELLISGDFETPQGVGDIPGWNLSEFITDSDAPINSADLTGGTDIQLFLRAFEGGRGPTVEQGNYDSTGGVDGRDFLVWQRGGSPNSGGPADLATWQTNYGMAGARMTNAVLTQTVPGIGGETYTFQGTSTFEDNYSGFVTTLDAEGPFGAIPSPTTTHFKMEFLGAGGSPLGSPVLLDLRTEQGFPGFPVVHTPLVGVAPAGTTNVRVTAEALNMVWNGNSTTMGALQSAFFNDFSLESASNPGNDLLTNGNLNQGPPDALDFWNQVETPATRTEILRTPIAAFSNHTPGGSRGVWLSAFFGNHPIFEPTPVTGSISQTVQAVAGAEYTFSGWTKFEANYSGGVDTISLSSPGTIPGQSSPTSTEIRLEFLDINSNVIASSVIDVKAARRLISPTGNANDNIWYQHTLQAVSPAGTVFARLSASMINGVFNVDPGQSAFFDDFSLQGPAVSLIANTAVPEPSSLICLALGTLLLGARKLRK
ncbi:MAG: PEP-CTERM sorting domain-containing protein [Pirellulales bacterium]|nr:PEP-CTERM sorting domain-containing protein [Pirellulales bacterium]